MLSVLIGGVIGWERGVGRRPAGFRTHILVSLGAAVAMLTGEMVTLQSGSGDATRIAAQVVSGIGFLGAGTILKVGVNIKGLTTAASLWATACLGLTAGAGLYLMAGMGLVIVLLTLTILERIEKHFFYGKMTAAAVTLLMNNPSAVIEHVNSALLLLKIDMHKLKSSALEDGVGLADRAASGSLSTPLCEKSSAAVPYPFVHYFSIDPDVVLNEDKRIVRKENGAQNLAVLKRMALNIVRADQGFEKASGPRKRFRASWDSPYLKTMLQNL